MKLSITFENNKEQELKFVFRKDEANEIILSFLQKNNLINNKDKCQVIYSVDENDIAQLIKIEEIVDEIRSLDIVSINMNKIEFKIKNNSEKNKIITIFIDYINNNFKYLFTTDMVSYSVQYEVVCEDISIITLKKGKIDEENN